MNAVLTSARCDKLYAFNNPIGVVASAMGAMTPPLAAPVNGKVVRPLPFNPKGL
jgi:hypothetical protein